MIQDVIVANVRKNGDVREVVLDEVHDIHDCLFDWRPVELVRVL